MKFIEKAPYRIKKHPVISHCIGAALLSVISGALGYSRWKNSHSDQNNILAWSPTPTVSTPSSQKQLYTTLALNQPWDTTSQALNLQSSLSSEKQQIQDILQYADNLIKQQESPLVTIPILQWDKEIQLTIKNFPHNQMVQLGWKSDNTIYNIIFKQWALFQREITESWWASYSGTDLNSTVPHYLTTSPKGIFNLVWSVEETKKVKKQQAQLLQTLQQLLASYKTTHLHFHSQTPQAA